MRQTSARRRIQDAIPFITGAVIVVILAAIWIYRAYQEDTAGPRTAIASVPAAGRDKDAREVWVDGWVDDSRIRQGGTVLFWISIRNRTDKPLNDVSVIVFRSPNFEVPEEEFPCWEPNPPIRSEFVPVCSDPLTRTPLEKTIVAGGVETIQGHLRARHEPGQSSISAVIAWRDDAGARHRAAVTIGPITVENELGTLSKAVQNFFKDLGLPLVLVWLGYRVRKIEERREEGRKRADERTAQVRQTWTQMLPKMHDNAEKYYMPLMGRAGYVSAYYPSNPEFCFYFYVRFLVKMREMVHGIGGFYLKTRPGEECVSALWDGIRECADARFGRPLRERAQDEVAKIDTVYKFREELPNLASTTEMLRTFRNPAELAAFEAETALFDLFAVVLAYEANCSYEFWYGEPEKFDVRGFDAAREKLARCRGRLRAGKFENIDHELNKYVEYREERARTMQLESSSGPA